MNYKIVEVVLQTEPSDYKYETNHKKSYGLETAYSIVMRSALSNLLIIIELTKIVLFFFIITNSGSNTKEQVVFSSTSGIHVACIYKSVRTYVVYSSSSMRWYSLYYP